MEEVWLVPVFFVSHGRCVQELACIDTALDQALLVLGAVESRVCVGVQRLRYGVIDSKNQSLVVGMHLLGHIR